MLLWNAARWQHNGRALKMDNFERADKSVTIGTRRKKNINVEIPFLFAPMFRYLDTASGVMLNQMYFKHSTFLLLAACLEVIMDDDIKFFFSIIQFYYFYNNIE